MHLTAASALAFFVAACGVEGEGPSNTAHQAGAQGPAGPRGQAGPDGPQGDRGRVGPEGPAGDDGAQGPNGGAGSAGPRGPAGAPGVIGPQGPIGAPGPQGPPGQDGSAGPQGTLGAVGPRGPLGLAGAAGPQGAPGPAGAIGAAGPDGEPGPQGEDGPPGPQGARGPQGPQGLQGQPGLFGITGLPGPQGPIGDAGAVGAAGPLGASGADGRRCWDLDGDGVRDRVEDNDGNTDVDIFDCDGNPRINLFSDPFPCGPNATVRWRGDRYACVGDPFVGTPEYRIYFEDFLDPDVDYNGTLSQPDIGVYDSAPALADNIAVPPFDFTYGDDGTSTVEFALAAPFSPALLSGGAGFGITGGSSSAGLTFNSGFLAFSCGDGSNALRARPFSNLKLVFESNSDLMLVYLDGEIVSTVQCPGSLPVDRVVLRPAPGATLSIDYIAMRMAR